MQPTMHEPVGVRTRRRAPGAPVKAAGRPPVAKLKTTCHFSAEAAERLAIHALKAGMDRSEFLESLILAHCRRWVLSDRGRTAEAEPSEDVSTT